MKFLKDILGGRINLIYSVKLKSPMIIQDTSNLKVVDVVDVICDNCNSQFTRTLKNIKISRPKWEGRDICRSCSFPLSAHKKPQCNKEYWANVDIKVKHGLAIRSSDVYYESLKNRPTIFGKDNPMFGKSHSPETIEKMSLSRIGKIGENATAWKGGKMSITRLVKGFQNRNGWYRMIYERDGFKCIYCGSKKKIEAHHIKPVKNIIDEYIENFNNNDDLYRFLISLPIIADSDLTNGITLCRECHKKEHTNFGSHNPIVNEHKN